MTATWKPFFAARSAASLPPDPVPITAIWYFSFITLVDSIFPWKRGPSNLFDGCRIFAAKVKPGDRGRAAGRAPITSLSGITHEIEADRMNDTEKNLFECRKGDGKSAAPIVPRTSESLRFDS